MIDDDGDNAFKETSIVIMAYYSNMWTIPSMTKDPSTVFFNIT